MLNTVQEMLLPSGRNKNQYGEHRTKARDLKLYQLQVKRRVAIASRNKYKRIRSFSPY